MANRSTMSKLQRHWVSAVLLVLPITVYAGSVLIETASEIGELKAALKRIESALGRDGTVDSSEPRTIDLDIVVWNNAVVDKDFYRREYLKHSVLELLPNLKY